MNTKWAATLDARKFNTISHHMINWGSVLLVSILLLVVSCSKSDDVETIDNESHIIYTDIEPDFTGENLNDFYELDLNNDMFIDFTLKSNYVSYSEDSINYSWEWLEIITSSNGVNGIISVTPWYAYTVPLNSDREIFNLGGYTNGEIYESWGIFTIGDCFEGGGGCYEDWKDKNDKYLGLRFYINGKTHYGWARLQIKSVDQWIIKDYAYNATPNKPILAGQKE